MRHLLSTFTLMVILSFAAIAQNHLNIIPKPNKITLKSGYFNINSKTTVYSNEKDDFNSYYLVEYLSPVVGKSIKKVNKATENCIILNISSDNKIPNEGYILDISPEMVTINASTSSGIFYGIQTLFQILPSSIYSGRDTGKELWRLPALAIEDSPVFAYRGMMLDVSRTFFDAETVKKYINWMSYHKLNKFHWHLTDDNGWRIEIKKYPELTNKGAWRGPNEVLPATFGSGNVRYGGYYTQNEVKDIVAFAQKRGIEIIPEIDLPGHSKAVTATYPQIICDTKDNSASVQGEKQNVWCVGKESNYKMLDDIIKELSKLFPSSHIHIGGDEVNMLSWSTCPNCLALMEKEKMKETKDLLNYFVIRMEKIVEKHGKIMAGWDEILEGAALNPKTRVYAWRSVSKGFESAKKGQPTVMQPGAYCYFDMKQSPEERGHNWAGIVTLEKSYSFNPVIKDSLSGGSETLIEGVQGGLWTELLGWPSKFLDYQSYPRMAALSEVGWTVQSQREWSDFNKRLTETHFDRLYNMGIFFRLPPPVVNYVEGAIKVTLPYSWAVVRYTSDESEPTAKSKVYMGEINTDNPFKYRFATFYRDELKSQEVGISNLQYPFQKPEVTIETSLVENPKFPKNNLCDNDFTTYFRSIDKAKEGDFVTYRFKEPVKTDRIVVETGIPNITFYGVNFGFVEYSYNGIDFIKGDCFERNVVTIYPQEKVRAVRINITAPNDGHLLAIQDLKIY